MLDIVKRQGDTPAVIKTLYQLVLSVPCDLSYYRRLKKVVPPADWAKMYDRILRKLNRFERFYLIMEYLPILLGKCHPELFQYGIAVMRDRVSKVNKSKEYAKFVKTLIQFSRLPGSTPYVTELLAHIRTTYKRRSALIEELRDLH